MLVTMFYVSGLAFAAFIGVIVGAGLTQAVQRDRDAKHDVERRANLEMVTTCLNAIDATHGDVEALINQAAELAGYNAQIIAVLQRGGTGVFVNTTGRPN